MSLLHLWDVLLRDGDALRPTTQHHNSPSHNIPFIWQNHNVYSGQLTRSIADVDDILPSISTNRPKRRA